MQDRLPEPQAAEPLNDPLQRLPRVLGLPCALIALAVAANLGGVDHGVADLFFDEVSGRFPLRDHWVLALWGHQPGKSALVVPWLALLGAALASHRLDVLRPWRTLLWATVAAMAAGPTIVVALKSITSFPCPWSLKRYGGFAAEATSWFVAPHNAGRCFPSGHSAGGFSLFAFVFAAQAIHRPRLARLAFWIAMAVGALFSGVRIAQGAHFLSHGLWAAAIDWAAAAIIFLFARQFSLERTEGSP